MNKTCQYCGEIIPEDAGRCPYCGSLLDAKPIEKTNLNVNPNVNPNPNINPIPNLNEKPNPGGWVPYQSGLQESGNAQVIPHKPQDGFAPIDEPLSNAMKVFMTVIASVIPGFGQIAGVVIAFFMLSSRDADRRSFGKVLMVASLGVFVFVFLICFTAVAIFASFQRVSTL